jgi:hypothetical protein
MRPSAGEPPSLQRRLQGVIDKSARGRKRLGLHDRSEIGDPFDAALDAGLLDIPDEMDVAVRYESLGDAAAIDRRAGERFDQVGGLGNRLHGVSPDRPFPGRQNRLLPPIRRRNNIHGRRSGAAYYRQHRVNPPRSFSAYFARPYSAPEAAQ